MSKTNCPNCGAPIDTDKCPYCGTVFIDFASIDADRPFYMKILHNGKIYKTRAILKSAGYETINEYLYANNCKYEVITSGELVMRFEVNIL